MGSRLRDYLVSVFGLWGKHISGPVLGLISIGLVIASAIYADDPGTAFKVLRWGAWITSCATIVLLVLVAPYNVWSLEREKYEAEAQKNAHPDIKGEAFDFRVRTHGSCTDPPSRHADIEFKLNLCNYRPVITNLTDIKLDGGDTNPPTRYSQSLAGILRQLDVNAPELPMGLRTTVTWITEIEIDGHEWRKVQLDLLKIHVIDGFGDRHAIAVRAGETVDL